MPYDPLKYKEKRDKVLGVKKRKMSFGVTAVIVSSILVVGIAAVFLPPYVGRFLNRNLDDAIYKVAGDINHSHTLISEISEMSGITETASDKDGARIIVTYDRTITDIGKISLFMKQKGIEAVLLNNMGHNERKAILSKEEALEAL